jgi:C-terminal processing protease CtpA/Prc
MNDRLRREGTRALSAAAQRLGAKTYIQQSIVWAARPDDDSFFDETTKVISDVYVYPDFNGKNWNAIVAKHRAAVAAGLDTEAFYNEMQAMVDDLGDEHSRFDSPVVVAEVQAELSGTSEFVGIGVLVIPEIDKKLIAIAGLFPGSPAEQSGLKVHDAILSVDGLPIYPLRGFGLRLVPAESR